ncbi:MAG: type II toxin-antitoxin system RelE/ParE family toxin [bacterium]|nr:type II toxin-antitoxin system RelE/ParE family toxin [bacterium]
MWEVEYTDRFEQWWSKLGVDKQSRISAAIDLLIVDGPNLGRPYVDTIARSRHSNMKELRVSTLRILFAFDPLRKAILLLGGDKSGQWSRWYPRAISRADDLYDQHLASLRDEGLI